MTASKEAKEAGFKSLTELSKLLGESRQTLNNWYHDKPRLFKAVVAGQMVVILNQLEEEDYKYVQDLQDAEYVRCHNKEERGLIRVLWADK